MKEKFLGCMLLVGWLTSLFLVAEVRAQQTNPLLEVLEEAQSDGTDALLPPLAGETTFQVAPSYVSAPVTSSHAGISFKSIETSLIRVTIGDVAQFGYLAAPVDGRPVAALLLIHEWWGLNDTIMKEADHLASLGYRVFVVDLFAGQTAKDRRQATALARTVQSEPLLERLGLWGEWLRRPTRKGDAPLELGVIGWGLGANYALQFILTGAPVNALALFYGEVVTDPVRLQNLDCPMLGIYAGRDGWVTPDRIDKFKDALAEAHVDYTVVSYDVAPGFMHNPETLETQRTKTEASQTLDEFLAKHLGGLTPRAQ